MLWAVLHHLPTLEESHEFASSSSHRSAQCSKKVCFMDSEVDVSSQASEITIIK